MKKIEFELEIFRSLLILFLTFLASVVSYLFLHYETLKFEKIFIISYVIVIFCAIIISIVIKLYKLLKRLEECK